MSGWLDHLIILPVVLPLLAGAAMLLVDVRYRRSKAAFNLLITTTLAAVAVALLLQAADGTVGVYRLGDWPAPFGIVLVADRLSALMLTLTSALALAALVFSLARWHRAGAHFHSIFQFLLMGLNGAFLTGDLFNLFVFFEVLLASSYGLVLHGSGTPRVRAALHYIAINLAVSLLFLIGVSLIYGVTGTLNMADLAVRIPTIPNEDRLLLQAAAAILGVAFLVKAAVWPLCFWLPNTYAAASAPAAAMFAIMSKVGVYVILRLWLLLFGEGTGESALFGGDWLLYGGIATILYGAISVLASQDMGRLAGYSVLVSSGTLLATIATANMVVTGSALFYLVSSTLAISAFFLLVELTERGRRAGAHILAVTLEAFGEPDDGIPREEEEVGVAIPATMAILGLSFVLCTLLLSGLPPLSGFIAKFALLSAVLGSGGSDSIPPAAWLLLAVVVLSGLTAIVAMTRAGINAFWVPLNRTEPRVRVIEMLPVAGLLALCLLLTVQAGPVMRYMQATAASLHVPQAYVEGVLAPTGMGKGEARP